MVSNDSPGYISVPLTIIVKIALEQTAGGQSIAVLLSDLNKE
ncbi:transporter [Escherichia coli]|nr:transporter [Escherichia coli]